MRCALGIDLGTGSTKAVLFDETGDLIGRGQAEYPLYKPHPGWVDQDPEDWWQGLCASARQAISGIDPTQVACVGLSGQINGAVFVDSAGQPLQRVPIWLDHRSQAECDWAEQRAGDLLREADADAVGAGQYAGEGVVGKRPCDRRLRAKSLDAVAQGLAALPAHWTDSSRGVGCFDNGGF